MGGNREVRVGGREVKVGQERVEEISSIALHRQRRSFRPGRAVGQFAPVWEHGMVVEVVRSSAKNGI